MMARDTVYYRKTSLPQLYSCAQSTLQHTDRNINHDETFLREFLIQKRFCDHITSRVVETNWQPLHLDSRSIIISSCYGILSSTKLNTIALDHARMVIGLDQTRRSPMFRRLLCSVDTEKQHQFKQVQKPQIQIFNTSQ